MADRKLPTGKTDAFIGYCLGEHGCGWSWPVLYFPMNMTTAAELMANARCPSCGRKDVSCG